MRGPVSLAPAVLSELNLGDFKLVAKKKTPYPFLKQKYRKKMNLVRF